MTKKEFAQLNRPSELIRVAVTDARSLDRSKYSPNAVKYHSPSEKYGCCICDAGAVMAGTLNASFMDIKTPYRYPREIQRRLSAINQLRIGNLAGALLVLNVGRSLRYLNSLRDDGKRVSSEISFKPSDAWFSDWKGMDRHLDSMEKYADLLEAEGY